MSASIAERTGDMRVLRGRPRLDACDDLQPAGPLVPGLSRRDARLVQGVDARRHLAARPELRALATREDDDPTIALLDAWSAVLDVLTFYQERIADEGFLGTAAERRSIRELARAIGYELGSGVAAETLLAFELETAPRGPGRRRSLAVGTKVQSVPGQDELPQTFETVEEIEARPEWNAIAARTTTPTRSADGATELFIAGTATNLRPGDMLLVTGTGNKWQVRRVKHIHEDAAADRTRVTLTKELDFPPDFELGPGSTDVRVFALRVRAALFGHNAPDWKAMPQEVKQGYDNVDRSGRHGDEWPGFDGLRCQRVREGDRPRRPLPADRGWQLGRAACAWRRRCARHGRERDRGRAHRLHALGEDDEARSLGLHR